MCWEIWTLVLNNRNVSHKSNWSKCVFFFCCVPLQAQIIRVLCRAGRVTKAAYNLIKSCGLLTWIIQMLERRWSLEGQLYVDWLDAAVIAYTTFTLSAFTLIRNLDQQLLGSIIELLHVLWFTILEQKEKQVDKPHSPVKCLPLPLIGEFLCVALTISRHLRSGSRRWLEREKNWSLVRNLSFFCPVRLCAKATQLKLFLQTLSSVLKNRGRAIGANKEAERLTLHPQPLSCTEALSLLLCWASSSCDMALISQIHALSEKHKLRELVGECNQVCRVSCFFSSSVNYCYDNVVTQYMKLCNYASTTGLNINNSQIIAENAKIRHLLSPAISLSCEEDVMLF